MKNFIRNAFGSLALFAAFFASFNSLVLASSSEWEGMAKEWVSIAQPGPRAIRFQIWTNKDEGKAFHPGDRLIINVRAEQQAYVTMLTVSSAGVITVVLPNKLVQDTMIQPNKVYTLFGDDFPVRLTVGDRSGKESIVLYLSATPLVLDPLQIPEGSAWLTLTGEARKEISILREKLRTIAKEEGFNVATGSLHGERGEDLQIKLTEVPDRFGDKGFPGGQESTIPETLTGSAGFKPPEDKQKQ